MSENIYQFDCKMIDGKSFSLSEYEGKTLLIVNTASKCGFTPQYEGLEALYEKYKDQGLVVMGFPCNQFGKQEPGNEQEIAKFCNLTYQVKFPLFAKVDVNGKEAAPIYQYLKTNAPGILGSEGIKWNFTKFLVNKNGEVVKRFAPKDKPDDIDSEIAAIL